MKSGAMLLVAVAVLGGVWAGAMGQGSFTAHMTAHVLAVAVIAPLLVIVLRQRPSWLEPPAAALAACGVELVVVWGWHLPWMHMAARSSPALFVLEQVTFLAAGYAVWASALPIGSRGRSNALAGVGALLLTSMHMTLLGGLLSIAPRPWYAHGGGSELLWDQQLGGLIMLSVGGIAYMTGALVLLAQVLRGRAEWHRQ